MITVGIRELKAKLSSYIDKASNGEQIVVTDRGLEVAVIHPVSKERSALNSLVKKGLAQWTGGKPDGLEGVRVLGRSLSATILEERE